MRRTTLPLFVTLLLGFGRPALAETRQDAGIWLANQIAAPVGEDFSLNLMIQSRWTREIDRYERTVVRPWLALDLAEGLQVALGYDAHLFENPRSFTEHRAWQRVEVRRAFGRVVGVTHFWLEERFFPGDDVAWRGRFLLGGVVALTRDLSFFARNEFLVDWNTTPVVRETGLGENQLAVGLSHRLASGVGLDIGYLQQYLDRSEDVFNHFLLVGFAFETPPLRNPLGARGGREAAPSGPSSPGESPF